MGLMFTLKGVPTEVIEWSRCYKESNEICNPECVYKYIRLKIERKPNLISRELKCPLDVKPDEATAPEGWEVKCLEYCSAMEASCFGCRGLGKIVVQNKETKELVAICTAINGMHVKEEDISRKKRILAETGKKFNSQKFIFLQWFICPDSLKGTCEEASLDFCDHITVMVRNIFTDEKIYFCNKNIKPNKIAGFINKRQYMENRRKEQNRPKLMFFSA